jgi:carbonic anhydrase
MMMMMNSLHPLMDFDSYMAGIAQDIMKSPGIPVLLLTCMDYRYQHRIINTMDSLGLRGKYDHLILAGAGLGINHKEEWRETFFDQLKFAMEHHSVTQLIILEHRDCGAYREFLGITPDNPAKEKEAHLGQALAAIKATRAACPKLTKLSCLLLPIEKVEELVG